MTGKLKRKSWLDLFKDFPPPPGISEVTANEYTFLIDDALHELWGLGRKMLLLWAPCDGGMDVIAVPYYEMVECETACNIEAGRNPEDAISEIVSGPKMTDGAGIEKSAHMLNVKPVRINLPFTPGEGLSCDLISELVRRYSISLVQDRAVVLLDSVGFSLLSPIQQVTQLNSLSYSVNSAYSMLLNKEIDIAFSRTTTGDGYYIWNRNTGIQANVDLYHFMLLILAHNAISYDKATNRSVPQLRSCFHVGSHYEFYQEESLSPTRHTYLVGDVTIELARMIEKSIPGQILVGNFNVPMHCPETGKVEGVDSIEFIRRTRDMVFHLNDVELSGDRVSSIKCYLTGPEYDDGSFGINQYVIKDKHGLAHNVYNAKINIERREHEPIYLGIQESELGKSSVLVKAEG